MEPGEDGEEVGEEVGEEDGEEDGEDRVRNSIRRYERRQANWFRLMRWMDFCSRVSGTPDSVYCHRAHGWRYIPLHPFGDEPEVLARLGMRPEDCRIVDAWWSVDRDATLLESRVVGAVLGSAGLFANATPHEDKRWVYLGAVFDAPFVTRADFEAAMVRFVEAGYPHAPQFQLRWGDAPVRIANAETAAESRAETERPG